MMIHTRMLATLLLATACGLPFATSAQAVPDVGAQWRQFLAHGTSADVKAAADTITAVDYQGDAVDADKCRAHADAVAAAVRRVPVSMLVQRMAMLCAQATGNREAADRASEALSVLAREAFAQADRGAWPRPIRIVMPGDAYALLASADMTIRYEYYTRLFADRYFPWVVAASSGGSAEETVLTFDFTDVMQTLDRANPAYGTPMLRMAYVNAFTADDVKRNALRGIDFKAAHAAYGTPGAAAKVEALRAAAERGGIKSAETWLYVCAAHRSPECGKGLIDALLPQAEAHMSYPTVLLAIAYAEGIGVDADPKAAATLLDAANRARRHHEATVQFADLYSNLHPETAPPPFLRERLVAASGAGNAAAAIALLSMDMKAKGKDFALSAQDEARLADPVNNGTGRGLSAIAWWYMERDKKKSDAYMQRAADAGDPDARRVMAFRLRDAQGNRTPSPQVMAWMARAGNDGDNVARYFMAYHTYMDGNPRGAEYWLLPAASEGDVDATFFLTSLWSRGYEGMSGTPERAVEILKALAGTEDEGAKARRRLASLAISGTGMPKSPDQARAWLLQDAEAGDAQSQANLGRALLAGDLGAVDESGGRKWMERAIAAGSADALRSYGSWLYYNGKNDEDRRRGATLSRQAADKDDSAAINNTAWVLCVSTVPGVRDPAAGMTYAKKLEATLATDPAELDTVAACEAAVGNYARAVELQQQVVAEVEKMPESDRDSLDEMQSRLALYRAGKPYFEEPAKLK